MSIVLEAVAGAALSAFFEVLFDKLSSPDLLNSFRRKNVNVDADLKNWETILQEISEVLDDAEEKQITKVSVKNWMAELEDLAYDADDILDEFATEALRRKVNAEEPSTSKIRKFIPACWVGLNPSSMFDANMRSKIKGINTRLDGIVTRKNKLELLHGRRRTRTITSREPETSLVEPRTYGRDKDKKAIVKLLLSGEWGGAQLSTISILGMGGLGKTTLAKLVYNDDEVGHYFVVKAWSRVSQDFDTLRVTKEILQDITSKTCNDNDLNLVQRELKKQLSGKKFLLILDDVWIENYSDWTKLRLPFESGAPGSKILITTRHANVSSTMGATHPYELRELSNDACLAMLTQHALGTLDFVEHLKTHCEKLEALSNNMHNLNFLQDLSIRDCPSIVSFPEEGFPTNLAMLWLSGANLCKQVFELGLHKLTSLTYLEIGNGIMDLFPEEEDGKTMLMLPTSLTRLRFFSFPNLLFLSWKFFQNLSALEEISIGWCRKLASLSEKCFPPSLQRLYISFCAMLKQNCEKEKGIMWSKIANIPSVIIDGVEQQK